MREVGNHLASFGMAVVTGQRSFPSLIGFLSFLISILSAYSLVIRALFSEYFLYLSTVNSVPIKIILNNYPFWTVLVVKIWYYDLLFHEIVIIKRNINKK
ncbi:hypothetical protein E2542_SST29063 [Spatholobus suberectus]|nr:hypothetical protein E2542_SST29063 [Spatholobus suberectus]